MSKSRKNRNSKIRKSRRRKIRGGCGCGQGQGEGYGIFKGGFPSENVIPLNSYMNDPSRLVSSSRLIGGKKRKSRKKKGGSSFSNFFNPLSYSTPSYPSNTNYFASNVPPI
jgi:hypothetical protein